MAAWEGEHSEQEARLRLIIEASPNAMIMVNEGGQILLVNSAAERCFGYERGDLLAMSIEDLVPERFRSAHVGYRSSYLAAPARRDMAAGRELFGLRSDGTEVPIELSLNPLDMGEEQYVLASVIDITERRRGAEAEIARRDDELRRTMLDAMPFSIIATDPSGRIRAANPAALRLLGYRAEELIGSPLAKIDAEPRSMGPDGTLVPVGPDVEWTYRRRDGRLVPVSEAVVALGQEDSPDSGFLIVAYDITKRIEAQVRIEYLATHDALTNLPNRTMFLHHVEGAIAQARLLGTEVVVLLLDLDHFKRVNDSLGHHVGDELLLGVSERLVAWIRRGDMVARLGGDEFVVAFTGVTAAEELQSRLEEIQELFGPVEIQGYQLAVTASTGAAVYPRDGGTPEQLLKHADAAMYRAKAAGRNNAQWFEPGMLGETHEKLSLSGALRQAIGTGELSTVYQPQVDLATGRLVGFEVLARWHSATMGHVAPARFIPVAEDGGMIRELGSWVLRTACADLVGLQHELGRRLRLAVNVSPRQLRGRAWFDEVISTLGDFGLEASQLELEVTEGLLVEEHSDAIGLLTQIREAGATIVVDDFGRGYSSLAYLTRFPIDKLKIDRSFIAQITSVDSEAAIVDAIIVMAHALGLTVVAEGVETFAQQDYLRLRGCDEVQGFYYGPGVPRERVAAGVRQFEPV